MKYKSLIIAVQNKKGEFWQVALDKEAQDNVAIFLTQLFDGNIKILNNKLPAGLEAVKASPSPKEEHTCPCITPCCGTAKYPGGARCGNCMRCAKGFDCQTPTPLAQRIEEVVSKWSSRYERCYMNDGEYTDAEIGKFLSKKVKLDYEFNINFLKSSLTQIAEEAKAEIEAQAKEAGADGRFWHYLEIEDLQKRERQNEREAVIKMVEGIKGTGYGHHDRISRIEIIKNLKK